MKHLFVKIHNNKLLNKRLNNELEFIRKKNKLSIRNIEDKIKNINFNDKFILEIHVNKNIFFKITNKYPFQVPELVVNGNMYSNILINITKKYSLELKYIGINDLYNNSIISNNNWSGSKLFNNILADYYNTITLTKKLIKIKYLLQLCNKYNIDFYITNYIISFI